ncbi:MAG: site-specific integrase [Trichococcus flocculiformis]
MIALNEEAAAMLEYCIQEARDIKADFGQILNQDDFIFLNPKRGVPYCVTHLNRIMSYVSEESGVKASPHMMRHTFTTQAALAGVNGRALADYLGHKKTSMTEHYTHATEEGSQKVIRIASTRMHG